MSGDTLPFPGGDFPRPFGVPEQPMKFKDQDAARYAGPESAAEHLRNALQLLDVPIIRLTDFRVMDFQPVMGEVAVYFQENIIAVRRRVAAALAQLEGK